MTTRVAFCELCGWWKASRCRDDSYPGQTGGYRSEPTRYDEGAAGSLLELDLQNIETPIDEVRSYLCARYSRRFEVHPRLFEETVASVFKDLGYDALVTAYSNDGGIDIILNQGGASVGIQVKRYRRCIKVEQIRSLAGALVLGGHTKGVFVTTSRFQKGVSTAAELFQHRNLRIELVDAEGFYQALSLAQIASSDARRAAAEIAFRSHFEVFSMGGYI